jgi:hypothetical protein
MTILKRRASGEAALPAPRIFDQGSSAARITPIVTIAKLILRPFLVREARTMRARLVSPAPIHSETSTLARFVKLPTTIAIHGSREAIANSIP